LGFGLVAPNEATSEQTKTTNKMIRRRMVMRDKISKRAMRFDSFPAV
jgi:hypothetical protein